MPTRPLVVIRRTTKAPGNLAGFSSSSRALGFRRSWQDVLSFPSVPRETITVHCSLRSWDSGDRNGDKQPREFCCQATISDVGEYPSVVSSGSRGGGQELDKGYFVKGLLGGVWETTAVGDMEESTQAQIFREDCPRPAPPLPSYVG